MSPTIPVAVRAQQMPAAAVQGAGRPAPARSGDDFARTLRQESTERALTRGREADRSQRTEARTQVARPESLRTQGPRTEAAATRPATSRSDVRRTEQREDVATQAATAATRGTDAAAQDVPAGTAPATVAAPLLTDAQTQAQTQATLALVAETGVGGESGEAATAAPTEPAAPAVPALPQGAAEAAAAALAGVVPPTTEPVADAASPTADPARRAGEGVAATTLAHEATAPAQPLRPSEAAQHGAALAAGTLAVSVPGPATATPNAAPSPLVVDGSTLVVLPQAGAGAGSGGSATGDGAGALATDRGLTATTGTPGTAPSGVFAQTLTELTALSRTSAPAQAAAAGAPQTTLAEQVRGPVLALRTAAPGEHLLTLKVTPESLGPVQVRAHIGAEGIRIELVGASDAARDGLRTLLTDLRRDLAATGMNASLTLGSESGPGARGGQNGAAESGGWSGQGTASSRGEATGPGSDRAADRTTPAQPAPAPASLPGAHGVDILT